MQRLLFIYLTFLAGCQSAPGRDPCGDIQCSGHGHCLSLPAAPTCVCDPGFLPSASGWLCLSAMDTSLCAGVDCSGRGQCVSSKGQAQCLCDEGTFPGAAGLSCADPCAEATCGDRGECMVEQGVARCICEAGFLLSEDGLICQAPQSTSATLNYSLTYDEYPEYSMGKAFLDLSGTGGKLIETMTFRMWFDRGRRGLARKTRQVLETDSSGKQVVGLQIDDEHTEGNVSRRRRGEYTLGGGVGSGTLERAGRAFDVSLQYKGSMAPIPMPGGYEYPGWTLGSFSPMFYILALSRYDTALMGLQEIEVLWPTSGIVGTVLVEADESWTAGSPVLLFPDFAITATYQEGTPVRISLKAQGLSWILADVFPMDLNLMDPPPTAPLSPAPLPQDLVESTLTFTSADGTLLAGTLAAPMSATSTAPAILLVNDMRARDRDTPLVSLPSAPLYAHLAAHLAHAGFTTLRWDPRGGGESQGDMGAATLTTFREDTEAALAALKAAPGVADTNVFVLSYGWSSFLALSILDSTTPVRGYIGLAPVLNQAAEVFMYAVTAHARAAGFSEKFITQNSEHFATALEQLSTGAYGEESYRGLSITMWEELLAFDGSAHLSSFDGPVLVIAGDQDMEVPPEQTHAFKQLAAQGGKENLTLHTLAGISHGLTEGSKADLWEAALLPLELPTALLTPLLDWINLNRADEQ